MRVLASLLIGLVAVTLAALQAAAAAGCAARFEEVPWDRQPVSGMAVVETSGVSPGIAARFAGEIDRIAGWLETDIGTVAATVCIVSPEAAVDLDLDTGNRQLNAAVLAEDGVMVVAARNVGKVGPAAAFGLTQLALWSAAEGRGWPEPLASAIGHWYRARFLDRLDQYRVEATGADFGGGNFELSFDTEARIPWAADRQTATLLWDPERNESPIGAFIEHAVATEGTGVLLDADPDRWSIREGAWRVALFQDLTGRTEPTTTWRSGVVITVVVLVVASGAATAGVIAKRRPRRRRSREELSPMDREMSASASSDPESTPRA